jgi:hypothetical protein
MQSHAGQASESLPINPPGPLQIHPLVALATLIFNGRIRWPSNCGTFVLQEMRSPPI